MLYVLIDNGHGVDTLGKCAPDKSILEYAYTREIAAAVYERLTICNNIKPILITPERKDIPLATRVQRINNYYNRYGAANCIMISIHLNATGNGDWMNARGWKKIHVNDDIFGDEDYYIKNGLTFEDIKNEYNSYASNGYMGESVPF